MKNSIKITVIGGSGLIGSKLVNNLRQQGHDVMSVSPLTGVDTVTGKGLADALKGAQVVVDVTNAPSWEDKAVLEFFETSTRNILDAEAVAGVEHHVALSVVGTDHLLTSGYFRAKMAQETLIKASKIPYTIVRSTQFFEFARGIAQNASEGATVRLPSALMQPIAADDVATALANVAVDEPMNGTLEIAGPEQIRQDELIREFLSASGDSRNVISDVHALYYGLELNDQSLVPGPKAWLGSISFAEWLSRSAPQNAIQRQSASPSNLSGKVAAVALLLCGIFLDVLSSRAATAQELSAKQSKVTLVFDHALPNIPGKSMKGVLVEYPPGGSSPAHTHPDSAFIYATVLQGAVRSSVNGAPATVYNAGENFYEEPRDHHGVSANASKTEPARLLATFVVDSDETNLTRPDKSPINPAENPKVEHRIREFLKTLNSAGGKPMETLTPVEARKILVDAQASVRLDLPPCDVEEKTIAQDSLKVRLTIVRPAGSKGILPGFIFVHGGGWILGDFPTHERFVRDLVSDSGFTAVFVNYTPSPEAHYPTAINEIYAATKWVAAHGAEIRVDAKRLAIVGNSVGGNMTGAVALMAKNKGGPELKCQIMLWPVTDANFETESYHEYADGYFLSRAMMMWFWDAYAPNRAQRREIYASPLQATVEQLKGLPPTLMQVAGNDVLRDEGLAYGRKLDAANVEVTLVRCENLIHDYGLLNAISQVPAVRDALHQTAEMLKKHLK